MKQCFRNTLLERKQQGITICNQLMLKKSALIQRLVSFPSSSRRFCKVVHVCPYVMCCRCPHVTSYRNTATRLMTMLLLVVLLVQYSSYIVVLCTQVALGLEMIKERTSKNVLNSNHLITSVSRTIKDKIESMMYLYIILSFQRIIQGCLNPWLEKSTLLNDDSQFYSTLRPQYEKIKINTYIVRQLDRRLQA